MAATRRGWKRLATVYGLVEQMRSAELRLAAVAVTEVEQALEVEAAALASGAARGRGAFVGGDGVDFAVAETTREFAEVRIERLGAMKVEREEIFDAAAVAYDASRLRLEQMKSVIERAGRMASSEESRRAQAEADDRHAGQGWLKDRAERKEG